MKRGYFLTIEGIEGAGKSTVMQFIADYLRDCKIDLVTSREFGGTEIAEKIRHILLGHHAEIMHPNTELLLAFAARAQHVENLIIPSLNAGKWVLCDRFTDSSYAYQGGGRGLDINRIALLEQFVQNGLQPDLTVLLDVDPKLGFQRIAQKRGNLDRIEIEEIQFFQRVREAYLARAKQNAKRFRVVDANLTLEEVTRQVEIIFAELIINA